MCYGTRIWGDYVLSPCENAFNEKTSFWLSKKGMSSAMYCFSVGNAGYMYDVQVKGIDSYIRMFQERYERQDPESEPLCQNEDHIPDNIPEALKPFYKKLDNDQFGGLLLYIPGDDTSYAVHVRYGCGDNLTREMIEEGYDDYVIIEVDEFDGIEWKMDIDGGQIDLRMKEDWNGHYNICQHVEEAVKMIGYLDGVDYIPLQVLK